MIFKRNNDGIVALDYRKLIDFTGWLKGSDVVAVNGIPNIEINIIADGCG